VSPLDRPVPPQGEEIHLPGGSLQPVLLTVGLTATLVGITVNDAILIAGIVLSVATILRWIADARREFGDLPADHSSH
jgi:hypothetical protein